MSACDVHGRVATVGKALPAFLGLNQPGRCNRIQLKLMALFIVTLYSQPESPMIIQFESTLLNFKESTAWGGAGVWGGLLVSKWGLGDAVVHSSTLTVGLTHRALLASRMALLSFAD